MKLKKLLLEFINDDRTLFGILGHYFFNPAENSNAKDRFSSLIKMSPEEWMKIEFPGQNAIEVIRHFQQERKRPGKNCSCLKCQKFNFASKQKSNTPPNQEEWTDRYGFQWENGPEQESTTYEDEDLVVGEWDYSKYDTINKNIENCNDIDCLINIMKKFLASLREDGIIIDGCSEAYTHKHGQHKYDFNPFTTVYHLIKNVIYHMSDKIRIMEQLKEEGYFIKYPHQLNSIKSHCQSFKIDLDVAIKNYKKIRNK